MAAFPTLAVAILFCLYNAYRSALVRREGVLRRRVAYMLWVMATGEEGE
jgi:hypothetical protein